MKLCVQEQNLVYIYHSGCRAATISQIREAIPYMDETDALAAHILLGKLEHISDSAFTALSGEVS